MLIWTKNDPKLIICMANMNLYKYLTETAYEAVSGAVLHMTETAYGAVSVI